MSALAARSSSIAEEDAPAPGQSPAAAVVPFRYRAFLSYSHRNSQWVRRLHWGLEAYRLDKDLVGRETAHGVVPKTLRPIFRDREDFSAGHSLTEQTLAALRASQFLIVVCSPHAARSRYVDQEIRYFKSLGRGDRVMNVIIAGEPGDPDQECFPPAVRDRIAPNGQPTGERDEPIAADARPQGDGERVARLKIVAGLLGVGFDEIVQRAKRAQRRRNLFRFTVAGAGVALAIVAALGWWGLNNLFRQFLSSEDINSAWQTTAICEHANGLKVADVWRIALAAECARTFNEVLVDLPANASLPQKVASLYSANLALLRGFARAKKLTAEQSRLLTDTEMIAATHGVR